MLNYNWIMVIELIYFVVHWLNAFPAKSGVSETLSPAVIMTARSSDYKKHCKEKFGSYVQTHEEDQPRNSLKARTIGAITLRPDNNEPEYREKDTQKILDINPYA